MYSYFGDTTLRSWPNRKTKGLAMLRMNVIAAGVLVTAQLGLAQGAGSDWAAARQAAAVWRAEHRIIDLHQHIDCTPQHLARAVKIMDAVGVGLAINLSGGTVTRPIEGQPSEFERNKKLADTLYPGRFLFYMNLDYQNWDQPDFPRQAVKQVEEGRRLGAAGFKEFKRLGLYLRDGAGNLLKVDDPKLDPMWKRLGELDMPVSIHVADPKAFWLPYNEKNERWKELGDHKNWWFGDTNKFMPWKELLESLNRVIARHPETTFVCVHFANNAEELDWVDASLGRYKNMMADLAARIPEIGRHDPDQVRQLFLKHQDRILFGTDFQVVFDNLKLILGSSGNEPPPADADAEVFFAKEWRWLETRDTNWAHMTPIQGDWTISSIGLPAPVLRKVYFDNARKLLARSLPLPVAKARHITCNFEPDGDLTKSIWQTATPVRLECQSADGAVQPELSTSVRLLWSADFLYLGYECPCMDLTVFGPPKAGGKRFALDKEGVSLWDRDVVEAFIGSDAQHSGRYAEFEVAPTNERLDLMVNLPDKDFQWESGFRSAIRVNLPAGEWSCEMRIPLKSLSSSPPRAGARWRLNLFRADRAHRAFLAWSPTLVATAHAPERFGVLEFVE